MCSDATRVVVVGNSVSVLCRPTTGGPDERVYAAQLRRACRERHLEVDVVNQGRWFEQVDAAFRRWDRDVAPFLPDVVIVNYGFVECQPWVLPHVAHRALLDWKTRTDRMHGLGRRVIVQPSRRIAGRMTTQVARTFGQRGHKLSPARFDAELTRFVRSCRRELGALVLVVGINPPGTNMRAFQPGIDERCERFDRLQRIVVARFDDPRVRFVDVRPIFDELGQVGASEDGIHLTPAGHERLAGLLADEIGAHVPSLVAQR